MGVYKLSKAVEVDLTELYKFGIEKFGLFQAKSYFEKLHDCLNTLATQKHLGRYASEF